MSLFQTLGFLPNPRGFYYPHSSPWKADFCLAILLTMDIFCHLVSQLIFGMNVANYLPLCVRGCVEVSYLFFSSLCLCFLGTKGLQKINLILYLHITGGQGLPSISWSNCNLSCIIEVHGKDL
jgi:hypothetical protein